MTDRPLLFGVVMMVMVSASGAVGRAESFTMPEQWTVFAPFAQDDPLPEAGTLLAVPERMHRPDGTEAARTVVRVPRGERLDLKPFFNDQVKTGNTAWLFTELTSDSRRQIRLGMGADWWFRAWLNGREVLATPDEGNNNWPPTVLDFTADVTLEPGRNVLAVRFVSGNASSLFTAGGPEEIHAASRRIGGSEDPLRFNHPVPFAERSAFPQDRQAIAAAELPFELPAADVDLSTGALTELKPLPKRQLQLVGIYDRFEVHDVEYRRFPFDPVKLLLSKVKYPAEDLHLDVVLWTTPPEDVAHEGELRIILKNEAGEAMAQHRLDKVSPTGWFFSVGVPPSLIGGRGRLEAVWLQGEREIGRVEETFEVLPPTNVATAGRVAIRVLNEPGVTMRHAPMTLGVPFPQGALHDESHVRLVDESGNELPLQTKITGRWSRFGAIKWLLCDFTADLTGEDRTLSLEYGPQVKRAALPVMRVDAAGKGFPVVDAGTLKAGADGLSVDNVPALSAAALFGAFVEHEDGRRYVTPAGAEHAVEELGSRKTVIRRTGWYESAGGERFCNFVTRFVFHHGSPLVRIYHTWIFTGDGNKDRIRDMGWRFDAAGTVEPMGFLTSFDASGWTTGAHLVQFDHSRYLLSGGSEPANGRTPGVMGAAVGGRRVILGAKDFWQNFPSELEFDGNAMVFHNWPRHNPPAYTPRPVAAGKAYQIRFAHEGELLDFTTPDEYLSGQIWEMASNKGTDAPWPQGGRDHINAQGVARTEEMVLYFPDAQADVRQIAQVMRGLNDETIRAVADPAWMTASGAFERIHHKDIENFPREEALYEQICHAPARWIERLEAYGMWVHGDLPVDGASLKSQTSSPRRTWKKGHHGWPYKWTPYARSGDPMLLKYAEAATRQMVDGNFKHYVSPEVVGEATGQGWTGTSLFPWFGSALRGISQDVDYLWHGWQLTGFHRARDVALLWAELVKLDTNRVLQGRISFTQQYVYLDTYKATFDPWFLMAAHEVSRLHKQLWDGPPLDYDTTATIGHFWKPGEYDYHRFTGREDSRRVALRVAQSYLSPWNYTESWQRLDVPYIEECAAAWHLTGDPYYLARIVGYMDSAAIQVYDAPQPAYLRGTNVRHGGAGTAMELFTGWYIQHFPLGLHALHQAGVKPEPIPQPFFQKPAEYPTVQVDGVAHHHVRPPAVLFRKAGSSAMSIFLDVWHYQDLTYNYRVSDSEGRAALQGEWPAKQYQRLTLPAEAANGAYRLTLEAFDPNTGWKSQGSQWVSGQMRVPVTGHDVPEVLVFDRTTEGTTIGGAVYEPQYWFKVPQGVDTFWMRFKDTGSKIWNPDGEVAWDSWRLAEGSAPPIIAKVPVPAEHAGKLWRVTRVGGSLDFVVDPAIPPYFSASKAKWFNPEESQ